MRPAGVHGLLGRNKAKSRENRKLAMVMGCGTLLQGHWWSQAWEQWVPVIFQDGGTILECIFDGEGKEAGR